MKTLVSKYGLLAGIVSLFAVVFALGGMYSRFMTAQIAVHEQENTGNQNYAEFLSMMDGATRVNAFTTTAVDMTYGLAGGRGDYSPILTGSYKVFAGDVEIGVIYTITSFGKIAELEVAYAIRLENDEVVAVKVLANAETPSYFSTLDATFMAQFDALPLADVGLAVDAVAGATYSSKGFEMALLYAREQYAFDYGFVIPAIAMTINALTYNLDPNTFLTIRYIADVTYGDDDVNVVVSLDADFNVVGLVTGTDPAADVKAAIKSVAAASGLVSTTVYFLEYNAEARELIIASYGYSTSEPIRVTFVLNATLDDFVSYVVDSNETYHEDEAREDSGYAGGDAPDVEENMIDQYILGEIAIDGVAGATFTSNAMQQLIRLLDLFLAANGGGA